MVTPIFLTNYMPKKRSSKIQRYSGALEITSYGEYARLPVSFKCSIILPNLIFQRGFMELSSVVSIFDRKAPLHLAESWDNVGLLVEPPGLKMISSVFFTNDLTIPVLEEAVSSGVDMIYCYHPPIFSPLKSLSMDRWKDQIIMTCIQKSIAIYSPHTALDAVQNGVNDWLISCFKLCNVEPIKRSKSSFDDKCIITCMAPASYDLNILRNFSSDVQVQSENELGRTLKLEVQKSNLACLCHLFKDDKTFREVSINQSVDPVVHGVGRIGEFQEPITIEDAIVHVKAHLQLPCIRISYGKNHVLGSTVKSVAVCAGSGANVLRGVSADLCVSGEMSHHDLLEASHSGTTVILCEHSNTERGYLKKLAEDFGSGELKGLKLIVSQIDRDPIYIE